MNVDAKATGRNVDPCWYSARADRGAFDTFTRLDHERDQLLRAVQSFARIGEQPITDRETDPAAVLPEMMDFTSTSTGTFDPAIKIKGGDPPVVIVIGIVNPGANAIDQDGAILGAEYCFL